MNPITCSRSRLMAVSVAVLVVLAGAVLGCLYLLRQRASLDWRIERYVEDRVGYPQLTAWGQKVLSEEAPGAREVRDIPVFLEALGQHVGGDVMIMVVDGRSKTRYLLVGITTRWQRYALLIGDELAIRSDYPEAHVQCGRAGNPRQLSEGVWLLFLGSPR